MAKQRMAPERRAEIEWWLGARPKVSGPAWQIVSDLLAELRAVEEENRVLREGLVRCRDENGELTYKDIRLIARDTLARAGSGTDA